MFQEGWTDQMVLEGIWNEEWELNTGLGKMERAGNPAGAFSVKWAGKCGKDADRLSWIGAKKVPEKE